MCAAGILQVVLFSDSRDVDAGPYEDAIVRAFQGGKEAGGYLASGDDLGIQLEVFAGAPQLAPQQLLQSFDHTVTVILIDAALGQTSDEHLLDWLATAFEYSWASGGRHALLALALDERSAARFESRREAFGRIQVIQAYSLGEPAIRPSIFALRVLHESRVRLAASLPAAEGKASGFLKLFISHSKADGLPLAVALKHQISSIGWLEKFYDAEDLPSGSDWKTELERGVGSSLIIMLRTEVYDSRYWCQQEVLWADEYATPAVLVDARTELNHRPSILPFDRTPTTRIPDGNLTRILFLALREGLRHLYFASRVEHMKAAGELPSAAELHVFSFQPSMAALLRICRSLPSAGQHAEVPQLIIYPDPPLRSGSYEAAQALVNTYAPNALLLTPNTLTALGRKT
jgi:hypothetical protein